MSRRRVHLSEDGGEILPAGRMRALAVDVDGYPHVGGTMAARTTRELSFCGFDPDDTEERGSLFDVRFWPETRG